MNQTLTESRITEIVQKHTEFEQIARRGLALAERIGELLIEQKALLGHGAWLPWVETNLPFSERSARRYMNAYQEKLTKSDTVADLHDSGAPLLLECGHGSGSDEPISACPNPMTREEAVASMQRIQGSITSFLDHVEMLLAQRELCCQPGAPKSFEQFLAGANVTMEHFERWLRWAQGFLQASDGEEDISPYLEQLASGELFQSSNVAA